MELSISTKQLISEAKNICLIPSQNNEPESLTSALALFYTLKELDKNVNLIIEDFPEKLSFLIPSIDFIVSPKNLVIAIPQDKADISQIYYEKNEKDLKIHLTVDRGRLKKEDFSFYFSEIKPDLIITLGIKDFRGELENKLDSFGFLLDVPILNIDTSASLSASTSASFGANNEDLTEQTGNSKFGQINLIEQKSLSEIVLGVIESTKISSPNFLTQFNKNTANCILAGLIIHYENFKNIKTNPETFEVVANLIKKGADYHGISAELQKITKKESNFLNNIFSQLPGNKNYSNEQNQGNFLKYNGSSIILDSDEFKNFGENEATLAIEKIKIMGLESDLLVLWPSHASGPIIKGFFYSKKQNLIDKILSLSDSEKKYDGIENLQTSIRPNWLFLSIPSTNINLVKETIIKLL